MLNIMHHLNKNNKWVELKLIKEKDKLWDYDDSESKKVCLFNIHKNAINLPFEGIYFYMKGVKYMLVGTRTIDKIKGKQKISYIVDLIKNTETGNKKAFLRNQLVKLIKKHQ